MTQKGFIFIPKMAKLNEGKEDLLPSDFAGKDFDSFKYQLSCCHFSFTMIQSQCVSRHNWIARLIILTICSIHFL